MRDPQPRFGRGMSATIVLLAMNVGWTSEPNYVKVTTFLSDDSTSTSVSYSDGLGRGLESQTYGAIPDSGVVSGTYYDGVGRATQSVKPFGIEYDNRAPSYVAVSETGDDAKLVTLANAFFGGTEGRPNAAAYAFSETEYLSDPLGRIKAAGAPGKPFSLDASNGGHPGRTWYFGTRISTASTDANVEADGFIKLSVLSATSAVADLDALQTSGFSFKDTDNSPLAPTHFLTVARDPNGHFTQEVKDNFGNSVATWSASGTQDKTRIIATYEYDILNNVTKQTPPRDLDANTVLIDPTVFTYNARGQMTDKTVPDMGIPGTSVNGKTEYRYDLAGRLRFVKTPKCAAGGGTGFMVYDYDKLGRTRWIGECLSSGVSFDAPDAVVVESGVRVASRNVYDSPDGLVETSLRLPQVVRDLVPDLANGYHTGRLVAEIAYANAGPDLTADLYAYDSQGRIRRKYKYVPGQPIAEFRFGYDRQGNVIADTLTKGGVDVRNRYEYDSRGRLSRLFRNGRKAVEFAYSVTGVMTKKTFYGSDGTTARSKTAYRYNIRDWVTSIEASCGPDSRLFAENVLYDEVPDNFGYSVTKQFNGNIGFAGYAYSTSPSPTADWSNELNASYSYDNTNRLVKADDGDGTDKDEFFSYDHAGRLKQKLKGTLDGSSNTQAYAYTEKTSRLTHIAGTANKGRGSPGAGKVNYLYDPNGNMILDYSKKMIVEYDWLDMPVSFAFYDKIVDQIFALAPADQWNRLTQTQEANGAKLLSTVRMVYDASGNRVLKTEYVASSQN